MRIAFAPMVRRSGYAASVGLAGIAGLHIAWGLGASFSVPEPFRTGRRRRRRCGDAASSSVPRHRRSPRGRQRALRGSPCRVCPAASSRPGGRGHLARGSRAHGACRSNGSGIPGQFVPEVPAPRSSLLRSALPAPQPRYCHRSTSSLTYKHLPRRVECQAAEPPPIVSKACAGAPTHRTPRTTPTISRSSANRLAEHTHSAGSMRSA